MRDRRSKFLMESGARDFFVIDVREVDDVENPQANLNHWGFTVSTAEEVKELHSFARANMEKYHIKKVLAISPIHEAQGFYFYDEDSNWWELEFRNGQTNDSIFSNAGYDEEPAAGENYVNLPLDIAPTFEAVVGPDVFLTHGTTDVIEIPAAQKFYEDILGLRSVARFDRAQFTAGGGDFAFGGVATGKRNAVQTPENRWILLVEEEEWLERIRDRAIAGRKEHDIQQIGEIEDVDGYKRVLICNTDNNWFEISTRPRQQLADIFARG